MDDRDHGNLAAAGRHVAGQSRGLETITIRGVSADGVLIVQEVATRDQGLLQPDTLGLTLAEAKTMLQVPTKVRAPSGRSCRLAGQSMPAPSATLLRPSPSGWSVRG